MFDVSFMGALLAGLLSFLSPCILPIVPFYLSYLAGVGMNQISAEAEITPAVRRRAVISAIFFSLGVITVFVGLGATATIFGQMVRDYFDILRWIAAAIIIAMGLHFLGVIRIGLLYRQFQSEVGNTSNVTFAGAFVIGLGVASFTALVALAAVGVRESLLARAAGSGAMRGGLAAVEALAGGLILLVAGQLLLATL